MNISVNVSESVCWSDRSRGYTGRLNSGARRAEVTSRAVSRAALGVQLAFR